MGLIIKQMVLSEVVEKYTSLIPMLNRFDIHLGLGDDTIQTICDKKGLDVNFFLVMVNTYLFDDYYPDQQFESFHIGQIVNYLKLTNNYYQHVLVPNIARHLHLFIQQSGKDNRILIAIQRLFDSFDQAVKQRINEDNTELFKDMLSMGKQIEKEPHLIALLSSKNEAETDTAEEILHDMLKIFIRHLSGDINENLCYAVIFAIGSLSKDFAQNNRIRNRILKPLFTAIDKVD